MGILLDLLNLAVYIPFLKVDEEEVCRNVKHLKKHQWFRNYLNDEECRGLIIHDKDVRQCIGKFNSSKLYKHSYQKKCQEKLHKVLLQNGNFA
ncbi:hypothetical protein CHH55_04670 [Niallia circulans]|uniref:Uncharacterized protein n=1 Tax=Niallia circulans TaxID=1397 RepID=A0A0J1LAJ0_NIACI|nr:hypothetical protein [Niallia circulans]KLV25935.1 hypothetical protein ABW02_14025 [Niallia circulans]MCM2982419.1 hypothetical protein [Niallia circulans]MED5099377.1 hypothetical protein [Niallia circulans]PAD25117.1 hypothetical protein CHH62_13645 [Niallia circulans]PAD89089.1 hypothetical protein CHH55_04670 [Niallia circulans]